MELTLDLSAFTSKQRYELLALIESFATPQYIPSADENSEHAEESVEKCLCCGKGVGGRCGACHCQMNHIKHQLVEYGAI